QDIARKHHTEPAQLPALCTQLGNELASLENAGERLLALHAELDTLQQAYRDSAAQLSAARRQAATSLGEAVTAIVHTLGMPAGEFSIRVHTEANATPAASGTYRIEYLIAANPGQAARPLERVASGGE